MTNSTAIKSSGSLSNTIMATLDSDYGIRSLNDVKSYCRSVGNDWTKYDGKMIDNVKEIEMKSHLQRIKTLNDQGFNPDMQMYQITQELEEYDRNLRWRYATSVARSLKLNVFESKLFVQLRLLKAWNWTEASECRQLAALIEEYLGTDISNSTHPMGNYYQVTFRSVATLASKGLTLSQIERLFQEVVYIKDYYGSEEKLCISTYQNTYSRGLHFGTWFARVVNGINQNHIRDFGRFIRVFKYTKFINPKLSHRQLKKLDKLSDKELKLTVTDHRNWTKKNEWGNIGFRLNAIVKTPREWAPIRKNHETDQAWLTKFGRVPKIKNIRELDLEIVSAFSKKGFVSFVSEIKQLGLTDEPHSVLALAKTYTCFGKEWKKLIPVDQSKGKWFNIDSQQDVIANIHDIGINLPMSMTRDQLKFYKLNRHNYDDAIRIVKSWDIIVENGVNPLSKGGLKLAKNILASLVYENVHDVEFAKECAKWGLNQTQFNKVQYEWINRNPKFSSIPKIELSKGDWKFYTLDKNDVRGPFLGEYTGCCQHPYGAGESCAKHGSSDGDGAFVVLEYRGNIKFQSWVWRKDNTLVFDNIEGSCKAPLYSTAKEIYLEGIKLFRGKFEISDLVIGTRNADIKYQEFSKVPRKVDTPAGCYTDSKMVWEVK